MLPLDPTLIERVTARLDSEAAAFRETGKRLYGSFEGGRRSQQISSQLRNLQQAAVAAQALYEVEYFVKNQMGREKQDARMWREVGENVLQDLERLRGMARDLAQQASDSGVDRHRLEHELRLRLVRGWIKIVVGEYMYQRALASMK